MAELDKINVNGELYDMSDSKARSDIASEITNRTNADKALDDKVKAETEARTSADNALNQKIVQETTDRTNADNALQEKINTNKTGIDNLVNDVAIRNVKAEEVTNVPEVKLPLDEVKEEIEAAGNRVLNSIPDDYTQINNKVSELKGDLDKLIVRGKTYQTIPGKAFNGFGGLADYDDAFLVLVKVPTDCTFLIVTKFNYQVAYGSGFRYSTPQYLDSDRHRISECKYNNGAYNVDKTNEFDIITLVNVPANATYIAIPYKNGTEYNAEYVCVNYADNIERCLIDGHLPYGIQLFEDGRNLVHKIFHNVIYSDATKCFNFKNLSRCTNPVLCNGGARIYHDGVKNTMYYYAFDNENNCISNGIINSGDDIQEIENAKYLIFESEKDFTWISYSDLSFYGYKQSKKIKDDFIDLHLKQKNLEYPYHDMVVSFLGDSLTANGSGGDYIRFINNFFGFSKITNCGIGGTRISGVSSLMGDPMWMDSRINALDINSDIIFIMGGTNDAPSGAPYLGEITPENHETSTFVGAYNVLLSKIFYRYGIFDGLYDGIDYSGVFQAESARDIRIFLITPPQRFPNRGDAENPWHYATNTNLYADAVLKIGAMHGIPVADIRSSAGINIFNRDRFICGPDVPNRNGSGVHLSADAHKRWAEVIIGKMLEIVNTD